MAGLQNTLALFSARDQVVGLGERGGNGLFDKQVEARIEQRRGHGMMMHGGNGDRGRVEPEIGGQQFVNSRKDWNGVSGRDIGRARRVGLDGSDQGDSYTGGIGASRLQLAVDAEVVFAKGAGPGDGNTQCGLAGYDAAPFLGPGPSAWGSLPSTTLRQRL